jgi:hypothetical protein
MPTTPQSVSRMARKFLGNNVEARPEEGIGNAFYTKERDEEGNFKHVITYDPRVSMGTIAHEIGHGVKPVPRVPLSGLIAPTLMASGLFNAGAALGLGRKVKPLHLGMAALGAGMYAPTLIGEHMASREAKQIMGEKPRGLGAAYLTYALPPLLAALYGAGAYGLARSARPMFKRSSAKFRTPDEAYCEGFRQKCAQFGVDGERLLDQLLPLRESNDASVNPNANQVATMTTESGRDIGTFGQYVNPLDLRAQDAKARDYLRQRDRQSSSNLQKMRGATATLKQSITATQPNSVGDAQ